MTGVKRLLFGSADRILATVSLVVGLLSLSVSIYSYKYPTPVPEVIVTRDFLIVSFLVLFLCVLCLKYFKKDELAERFRSLLENQLISCHKLQHKFRDHFFSEIRLSLLRNKNNVDDIKKEYFKKICHSVLMDVREIFEEYFLSRGIDLKGDLAVTLKVVVSSTEAQKIEDSLKGEKADKLNEGQNYIVTAYRDPKTYEQASERKEIRQAVYKINEENTAFDKILNHGDKFFLSNDLRAMEEQGQYRNQNPNWRKIYNSTLVVPVQYAYGAASDDAVKYGVLAIDSLNIKGYDLFDESLSVNILAIGADVLALMFGHLEMLDVFQKTQQGDGETC